MYKEKSQQNIVFRIAVLFIAFMFIWNSFYILPTGKVAVLTTFGNAKEQVNDAGLHFKLPFVQKAIKMDVKIQKYTAELTASSKDLQDVKSIIAINYRVNPEKVLELFSTIGTDYSNLVIVPLEQEANKATTAQYTAEQLITNREEVRASLSVILAERMKRYNLELVDVSIVDFKFSPSFTEAIEAKVTAEQTALKEQNNLKTAQFIAQQKVESAKGDAESVRIVSEELSRSPKYIDYFLLQKWNGVMPLALGSGTLLSIGNNSN